MAVALATTGVDINQAPQSPAGLSVDWAILCIQNMNAGPFCPSAHLDGGRERFEHTLMGIPLLDDLENSKVGEGEADDYSHNTTYRFR